MLFKIIREKRPDKPKAWQRIADFILSEPATATTMKLKEFSERVGVSEGSVVNFARSLGYEGYIELKVGIAQAQGKLSPRYDTAEGAAVLDAIVGAAKLSLEETARTVNGEALSALAHRLAHTKGRVLVCGRHTSAAIAQILAGYLMRLGVPAFTVEDARLAARSLCKGDELIAVTYSGRTEELIEAMSAAREGGAHLSCITAFEGAPIPRLCDLTLTFTSTESKEGDFPLVARLAQLAVCDALCAAVGAERKKQ